MFGLMISTKNTSDSRPQAIPIVLWEARRRFQDDAENDTTNGSRNSPRYSAQRAESLRLVEANSNGRARLLSDDAPDE